MRMILAGQNKVRNELLMNKVIPSQPGGLFLLALMVRLDPKFIRAIDEKEKEGTKSILESLVQDSLMERDAYKVYRPTTLGLKVHKAGRYANYDFDAQFKQLGLDNITNHHDEMIKAGYRECAYRQYEYVGHY